MAFAGHVGVTLNVDMLTLEGDGITKPNTATPRTGRSRRAAAARTARSARCSTKNSARSSRCARRIATRCCIALREHGLSACSATSSASRTSAARSKSGATRRRVYGAPRANCIGVGRGELAHRASARQPRLRRRRTRRAARRGRSGHLARADLRSGATTWPRRSWARRAPERRDPARAGRQLATSRRPTRSTGPASTPTTST